MSYGLRGTDTVAVFLVLAADRMVTQTLITEGLTEFLLDLYYLLIIIIYCNLQDALRTYLHAGATPGALIGIYR